MIMLALGMQGGKLPRMFSPSLVSCYLSLNDLPFHVPTVCLFLFLWKLTFPPSWVWGLLVNFLFLSDTMVISFQSSPSFPGKSKHLLGGCMLSLMYVHAAASMRRHHAVYGLPFHTAAVQISFICCILKYLFIPRLSFKAQCGLQIQM